MITIILLNKFLVHVLIVAGKDDLAGEVRDLLRARLIYYQLGKYGNKVQKKLIWR